MHKMVEVVLCDFCKSDRPAHSSMEFELEGIRRSIDLCKVHSGWIVEKSSRDLLKCPSCDFTGATKQSIAMHRFRKHGEKKK